MFALLVGAQLVLLLGMIAVSVWGRTHLEPTTRIRVRSGATGIDWTISKNTALLLIPINGLLVVLSTMALGDGPEREAVAGVGLAVNAIFLAAHRSSVKRAANR